MIITASTAQLLSAGQMDVVVRMTDLDAKTVMVATPNVKINVNGVKHDVYEMNPTVVPNVYTARLRSLLNNSIAKDAPVTFEV
jgi:hypothetical protein